MTGLAHTTRGPSRVRGHLSAYLAGIGATSALTAGAVVVFLSMATFVAFNGVPFGGSSPDAGAAYLDSSANGSPTAAAAALGEARRAIAKDPVPAAYRAAYRNGGFFGPGSGGSAGVKSFGGGGSAGGAHQAPGAPTHPGDPGFTPPGTNPPSGPVAPIPSGPAPPIDAPSPPSAPSVPAPDLPGPVNPPPVNVPSLPEPPSVPNTPSVPDTPSLPNVPNLPRVPSLGGGGGLLG